MRIRFVPGAVAGAGLRTGVLGRAAGNGDALAFEAAAAPFEALYVGDAEGDVVAGRRAGMRTVAASYGYLVAGADPARWGANAVIDSPGALLGWLDRAEVARG